MRPRHLLALLALATVGCLFDNEESGPPPLTSATLAETGLAGSYGMVDFRLEFTNGLVIDTAKVKLRGLLTLSADSAYLQRIWIDTTATDTRGKITSVHAQAANRGKGNLSLTLEGSGTTGESDFELKGDTLLWTTVVEPSSDGRKTGFKESSRWVRTP